MTTTPGMNHLTASGGGSHDWPAEIAVILIFAGVIWLIGRLRKRRNTPRFEGLAQRYQGTYAATAEAHVEAYPGTDWRPVGNPFPVENYVTGYYRQRRFYCFGWEYRQDSALDGDVDATRTDMSVYAMELPGYYGHFSVRRHSALRGVFAQSDIRIGHPEFDEHYTVRGQEPQAAVHVLRGGLAGFLLADPRSKDHPLWFMGDRLVCAFRGRLSPKEAEPVLEYLSQVAGLLGPGGDIGKVRWGRWEDVLPVMA